MIFGESGERNGETVDAIRPAAGVSPFGRARA